MAIFVKSITAPPPIEIIKLGFLILINFIKLVNSFPAFLGVLSMQYCSVVPKIIIEKIDFHSNPIGTGPFKFQKWK